MNTTTAPDTILDYWFGVHDSDLETVTVQAPLWWRKRQDTDADIRSRFLDCYEQLAAGRLEDWKDRPDSRLAMIILADQFPRNMFRGTDRAFSLDPAARALVTEGISLGMDTQLRWPRRVFFYMPLEHSEDLADQELSVRLFREIADSVPAAEYDKACSFVDFALRHWEIIRRFGRFPHRNQVLGRDSTAEELTFLQQPGSSF